jgi:hypothetical protein
MYYPLTAFLMLFANTLHNPEDPSTQADTELMDLVMSILSPMEGLNRGAFNAAASVQLFGELRNVAKKFLASNYRDLPRKIKREYNSDLPKSNDSPSMPTVTQSVTPMSSGQIQPGQIFIVSFIPPQIMYPKSTTY